MGNMGTIPAVGYESSVVQTFSSPTGTSHTMTYTASVNDMILVINNVIQEPTVAYTTSGTTLTTGTLISGDTMYIVYLALTRQTVAPGADTVTNAMIVDNAINSEHYTDGSIDLAHMSVNSIDSDQYVDGSIDLAHMSADSVDSSQYVDASIDNAHLADDAVGVAELSATGTASSSTFLRGDNAWAAAGGGWTALASTTASNDASVAFTSSDGINHSTYFTYMIVGVRVKPATTGVNLYIALSDDNGASYEADAGDYAWGIHQVDQDGVSATNYSASSTVIQMVPTVQTNAGPGVYFTLIWNPIASATAGGNEIYWDLSGEENTSSDRYRATGFGGTLIAAGDSGGFDAIRFIMSSGNITSGEFSLYGLTKP